MQERDRRFFFRFLVIFDSSLTFAKVSDFIDLLLRSFLLRRLQKLSVDGASNDFDWNGEISNRCKSFSVCEVFNDCAKTSLIKSGWLLSNEREEVLCFIKVLFLHALTCGNELGRTAKDFRKASEYVPPERSSRNSSSSEELIRSSANEDCRESDCENVTDLSVKNSPKRSL